MSTKSRIAKNSTRKKNSYEPVSSGDFNGGAKLLVSLEIFDQRAVIALQNFLIRSAVSECLQNTTDAVDALHNSLDTEVNMQLLGEWTRDTLTLPVIDLRVISIWSSSSFAAPIALVIFVSSRQVSLKRTIKPYSSLPSSHREYYSTYCRSFCNRSRSCFRSFCFFLCCSIVSRSSCDFWVIPINSLSTAEYSASSFLKSDSKFRICSRFSRIWDWALLMLFFRKLSRSSLLRNRSVHPCLLHNSRRFCSLIASLK